ncbi:signal peptidase II, partial [Streptomyces seoulensis]
MAEAERIIGTPDDTPEAERPGARSAPDAPPGADGTAAARSEERRGGKECNSERVELGGRRNIK